MLTLRKKEDRGHSDLGWLDSYHSFSFSDYYDEKNMGFSDLRVINQDRVAPGGGFGTHSHRDMEIVSYVLEGALGHKDSMGTGSTIRPGDVQIMSAGTGVSHSEMNASDKEPVHFLQIWILPQKKGLKPGYEQKHFSDSEKTSRLRLVASPEGKDGSVTIHQDASIYASLLNAGENLDYENPKNRRAWVQAARGQLQVNGLTLRAGDGLAVTGGEKLRFTGVEKSEYLLFDLA